MLSVTTTYRFRFRSSVGSDGVVLASITLVAVASIPSIVQVGLYLHLSLYELVGHVVVLMKMKRSNCRNYFCGHFHDDNNDMNTFNTCRGDYYCPDYMET